MNIRFFFYLFFIFVFRSDPKFSVLHSLSDSSTVSTNSNKTHDGIFLRPNSLEKMESRLKCTNGLEVSSNERSKTPSPTLGNFIIITNLYNEYIYIYTFILYDLTLIVILIFRLGTV